MAEPELRRGFFQSSRAWYADTALPSDLKEEFMIGLYAAQGGGPEFSVRWRAGDEGESSARLEAYDDSWEMLVHEFSDLLASMAERRRGGITPRAFAAMLVHLGIEDMTPTTKPPSRW